jgi:hypothetical protein
MAVNMRQFLPLRQAKAHRLQMPRYLKLDGGRYLIAAAVLLSLISLLTLGQTGQIATKGYEIARLQNQRTELLRQRSALQMKLSESQSLDLLKQRATQQGLRPMTTDQVRYMTVSPPTSQPAPTNQPAPASQPAPKDAGR